MELHSVDSAAAGDRHQRVGLGGLAVLLHRSQMQPRQRADDFQVAELLGADVHEQILALGIFAVQPLNRVLHGSRQLAVGAAELLQQHISKTRVWIRRRGPCTSAS